MKKLTLITLIGALLLSRSAHAFPASWWNWLRGGAADSGVDSGVPADSGADSGSGPDAGFLLLDEDGGGPFIIVNLGQSLACRATDDGGLSATQPYANLQVDGGLTPLIETIPGGESPMPGNLNQLSSLRAAQGGNIAVQACAPGTAIAGLMDGGSTFNALMRDTATAKAASPRATIGWAVVAEGEQNGVDGTPRATVTALMRSWRNELEQGFRMNGTLPADRDLLMLVDQEADWTKDGTSPLVIMGQWDAMLAEPNHFYISQSKSAMKPYIDGTHTGSLVRRWTGQQLGKIADDTVFRGRPWETLHIRRAVADGSIVRTYWAVPCLMYTTGSRCSASPPIVFDVSQFNYTFQTRGVWYGLRYIDTDATGVAPYIVSAPTIASTCAECAADEWRIDIQLDKQARVGSSIGIADTQAGTGTSNGCLVAALNNGCNADSNIFDTDTTAAYAGGNSLRNHAVTTPPVLITGGAAVAADDGVVLAKSWWNHIWYASSDCVATPNYTPFPDRIGALDPAINTTLQDYTCGTTLSGLSAKGLGATQVANGMTLGPTTNACWNNNNVNLTWGGLADGEDMLIGIAYCDTDGEATNRNFMGFRNSATEFWNVGYSSAERWNLNFQEAAMGAQYVSSTSATMANGCHYISIFFDGDTGGGFAQVTVWADADAAVVSAVSASNPGPFATTGLFTIGGNSSSGTCSNPLDNFQMGMVGLGHGASIADFNTAGHLWACKAMGIAACQ